MYQRQRMPVARGGVNFDFGALWIATNGPRACRLPRRRRPANGKEIFRLGDEVPALVPTGGQQQFDALACLRAQTLVDSGTIAAACGSDEEMNRSLGIVSTFSAGTADENQGDGADPAKHGQPAVAKA